MNITILPGTDLPVSRLSFGTASLHHLFTSRERQKVLQTAASCGFTHFDTAPYYGFGLSELELGKFLATQSGKDMTVASKVGLYPPGGCANHIITVWARKACGKALKSLVTPSNNWSIAAASASLDETLRRLRRSWLDILLLHEPFSDIVNADEFLAWLELQRSIGKIRYWGLAGPPTQFAKWVHDGHEVAQVLQVPDCRECDDHPILSAGREFQITYGCMAQARRSKGIFDPREVVRGALDRNKNGTVLVSARRTPHIIDLATIEGDHC